MKIKIAVLFLFAILANANPAHASMFQGEALNTVADIMSWVVLIFAPIIGIAVFLLVHILPEKIAEKKQHPQTQAIQALCILSLFFGGLLWPLAWLWAYSKPVMYKLAYGTDKLEHGSDTEKKVAPTQDSEQELNRLRQLVSSLETQLREQPANGKEGA